MNAPTGYRAVEREEAVNSRELAAALAKDGQLLIPILELITSAKGMVDEAIDVLGRGTIRAVLELSARGVAGAPHQGKPAAKAEHAGVTRHGHQNGAVRLSDRTLKVEKPRLRSKGTADAPAREVEVPAYAAMREPMYPGTLRSMKLSGVPDHNAARPPKDPTCWPGTMPLIAENNEDPGVRSTQPADDPDQRIGCWPVPTSA